MQFDKQTVRSLLLVVCGGIAFYAVLMHLGIVADAILWLLGILSPLLLGCAIAFILNVPMRAIERGLLPHTKKAARLRRPLALVCTIAAVAAVLTLAGLVIVPGVKEAVLSVAAQIPNAFQELKDFVFRIWASWPMLFGGCWVFCPRCCWAVPSPLSSMCPCGLSSAICVSVPDGRQSSAVRWHWS